MDFSPLVIATTIPATTISRSSTPLAFAEPYQNDIMDDDDNDELDCSGWEVDYHHHYKYDHDYYYPPIKQQPQHNLFSQTV